jgi:hypothetical protein
MDPEQERIHSYLQAQAAKLSIAQLVERIGNDLAQVDAALQAVPPGRFDERPANADWSANEIAAHLVRTSRSVANGISSVLDSGAQPERVADAMEGTGTTKDAPAWYSELRDDRQQLFDRVQQATGDEHLDITWEHPMFGQLNWREWLLFTRLHDLDHARQLQQTAEALDAKTAKGDHA